jgi:hypothetical protein
MTSRLPRPSRPLALVVATALSAGALAAAAAPPTSAQGAPASKAPVNHCNSRDNTDPSINLLRLRPLSLDVTGGSKKLTVKAKLSDEGGPGPKSGVSGATITLTSVLDPNHYFNVSLRRAKQAFTWTGTQVFPRGIVGGDWQVSTVFVTDKAGNQRILGYGDLNLPVYDRDVDVTSNEDTSPPDLLHVTLQPKRVDTRKHFGKVVVTAKTRDTQSAGVGQVQVAAQDAKGNTGFANLTRVKGRQNLFRGRMFIPQWLGSSSWHLSSGFIYDRVGNSQSYTRADLASLGDHTFRTIGRVDKVKPRVTGFHISTRHVDVRKKAKTLSFQFRVRDGLAGVGFASAQLSNPQGRGAFASLRPVGTNPHNVVFKGRVRIGPCQGIRGPFKVELSASDAAGNTRSLTRGTVTVRANDSTTPMASMTAFAQDPISVKVNFDESVDGISANSVNITTATENAPPIPISPPVCWSAENLGGSQVDCLTGHVRSMNIVPIAPLPQNTDYYAIINPEGTLDVTDLAGNPFRQLRLLFEAEV